MGIGYDISFQNVTKAVQIGGNNTTRTNKQRLREEREKEYAGRSNWIQQLPRGCR
jgi:hypothetical protein